MIIYKDRFTGDEMLSDIYKIKVINDMFYEVEGKMMVETTTVDERVYGGNKSAEGGDEAEATEDSTQQGCNIVITNRLQSTLYTKKSYQKHLKAYMKKIKTTLEESNPGRVAAFAAAAQIEVKNILDRFKDWEFYTGESRNDDGMVALLDYREDGVTPYMLFWKDGLKEEKV